MRTAIVGGGPGGLYLARLLRRRWPDRDVHMFEQNAPDATFGFGVTLGGASLGRLRVADPELADRIAAVAMFNARHKLSLNGNDVLLEYAEEGASIERLTLLRILQELCAAEGVDIRYETRIEAAADLADYDLIVGADGANSALRAEQEETFGTGGRVLTNRFAWYGVAKAMEPSALVFRSAFGGSFIAHYYAYRPDMSTFVAECDEAGWVGAGMKDMADDARRRLFEELFAAELGGAGLVENRSVYRRFAAVANRRWVDGKTVLIGDAQRVAHFSIGSGTRLAMDDAYDLYEALADSGSVVEALALFVERRQPVRDRFAAAAERSFDWYERVGAAMRQLPIDFVYDFLTRTGRIDNERLATYAPSFARLYAEKRPAPAMERA